MQTQTLIEKIENLPPEKTYEVEVFVDSLQEKSKGQNIESRFQAILEYAEKHAGSDVDLI